MRGVVLGVGIALGCGLAPYSSGTEGAVTAGGAATSTSSGGGTTGGTGSPTTGTTGGGPGESVGSSGCASPPCAPDVGAAYECNVWIQDCPEGQKCGPYGRWGAPKCVPVAPGAGGLDAPCIAESDGLSGSDDCAEGFICWNLDAEMHGTCVPQCTGDNVTPVCPPCSNCYIAADGVLTLCLPGCAPLDGCGSPNSLCIPIPGVEEFVCVDGVLETLGLFASCETLHTCEVGLWCGPPELAVECDQGATGCCLPFCDLSAPSCPGVGQVCVPWFAEDPGCAQYQDVGRCELPP